MKKIVVISNFQSVSILHQSVLEKLFDVGVEIIPMSVEQHIFKEPIDADILLISLYSIYVGVQEYVQPHTKVIVLSTTITVQQYELIREIPIHNSVLLVNYSPEMTLETLAMFRQIGLTDYDFIPVYPGKTNIPKVPYAVTPGESDKVPDFVEHVVDIGHRTLSISTITDVAVELGKETLLNTAPFISYFKELKKPSSAVSVLLGKANNIESRFFKLLNYIDEGILFTNNDGIIFAINNKALEVLGLKESCIGENIGTLIPNEFILQGICSQQVVDQQLLKLKEGNIAFKSAPVWTAGEVTSILMTFNRFEEKEETQHRLRAQILGKGHRAKYHFEHILGTSSAIEKTKTIAEKMAKSRASVLITGESGTGKELFAQAIHNSSDRRDYQFVALNCATIPESLLESELFGYDEGAFSGARKGGKIGLFELAHNGTIFLDEIGEMPIHLQSRLLRVLQEREVMRVGGDTVIHVDVRIIAATNQNLKKLMGEHQFRTDLYYRLNVLTLNIPPLRNRGEDILLIFNQFKSEIKAPYELTEEALQFMLNFKWEGNVRALRNSAEYFSYLSKDLIPLEEVQTYLEGDESDFEDVNKPLTLTQRDFILKTIFKSREQCKRIGRRTIFDLAKGQRFYITECDIRRELTTLEEEGLVTILKGRGGTVLSDKGLEYCNYHFNK